MAGEWIPLRTDIFDCPQVVRILSELCPDSVRDPSERVRKTSEIVGALVRMWALFDRYTEDGILRNYTPDILDQMVGIPGFSESVEAVGWLSINSEYLEMPEFSRYLSKTAKGRMKDSQRKQAERATAEKRPKTVQENPDKTRTTIQYNTKENNTKKEEIHSSSSELLQAAEPVDTSIVFDCIGTDGGKWSPPLRFIATLEAAFPHLNIREQMLKAVAWIAADPPRRKTKRGMPKFLNRWMGNATDAPGYAKKQSPSHPSFIEQLEQRRKELTQ